MCGFLQFVISCFFLKIFICAQETKEYDDDIQLRGFVNQGNTCYLASALVALRPLYRAMESSRIDFDDESRQNPSFNSDIVELYREPTPENFKGFISKLCQVEENYCNLWVHVETVVY